VKEVASSWQVPARTYAKGIGEAVADRTINRKKPDGKVETWEDVAFRVSVGNTMLNEADAPFEFDTLHKHLRQASVLMSGRHLQHGDETQPTRNQEVFTNCSTAASSFLLFYLLLNGSGVGRAYDDDMMVVDWSQNMPQVRALIRADHPDVLTGEIPPEMVMTVESWNVPGVECTHVYVVPDSREGWAKAIEQIEYLTWTGTHANEALILDFSQVRERGAPIGGMQNRPASGPGPLMEAIKKIADLRGNGMSPWLSNMWVDHFESECVLVGGARRAARMATKTWRDKSVLEFVNVKKGGVLWSSNNSVTVDEEFWAAVKLREKAGADFYNIATPLELHAVNVFEAICQASYHDGTGEPGIINAERLTAKQEGLEILFDGNYAESKRFQLDNRTRGMTAQIAKIFAAKPFPMITNPCGEITLIMLGAYCVIADVVPYHAGSFLSEPSNCAHLAARDMAWDNDAEDAMRAAVRALIRVNTMDCLYKKEVQRTNRIGVGMTGLHEYAWARFGLGWRELVGAQDHYTTPADAFEQKEFKLTPRALEFWRTLSRFSNACVDEARRYSAKLGVAMPHTVTTMKPAGTTSKLFGLTEGAHLPSMREYLRWVQFRNGDPLIAEYAAKGYPVRELKTYGGTTIVGFPTAPEICTLGMGDALVTAAEATPEEQYEFLRLMEKYWIDGYEETVRGGDLCVGRHSYGNQVSYTLKYKPEVTSYEEFRRTLLEGQSTIKCCSVMPQGDTSAYEYLPEQPIETSDFRELVASIRDTELKQDIGFEHVDCGGGACPIDFGAQKVA
jgi:ribonucleoside-triphosphate reductase (formate)